MRRAILLALLGTLTSPTQAADQERQTIILPSEGREQVLQEMRQFLNVVQIILQDAQNNDMKGVESAARSVGAGAMQDMPASVMKKLPAAFRTMGRETHLQFDAIADDARDLGDSQHTLEQLGNTLQQCNACHRSFRLSTSIPGP